MFGAVLARALDSWWVEMGQPSPFTVVEAGAGRGVLAKAVLAAAPACRPALRYVAVERSSALRAQLPEGVEPAVVMPEQPSNITFGGDGFSTLFITAETSVYQIETRVVGSVPGNRLADRAGAAR